jgi:3-phosphoshikimate 1-carboxyvinyltransferase
LFPLIKSISQKEDYLAANNDEGVMRRPLYFLRLFGCCIVLLSLGQNACMEKLTLKKNDRQIRGTIELAGSKSIANRALIIRALCKDPFPIHRIANANDTQLMQALIESQTELRDAGPAGTTFRFMTAYLSLQAGAQVLTGTERMKQRPIGLLVNALKSLGADIQYLEKEGYPPLKINAPSRDFGKNNKVAIPADTSSQYVSALLMIAPTLPNGLELSLVGDIVSRPYLEMTLSLMKYFGISYEWKDQTIHIAPQEYVGRPFTVEADWSAASYHYALAAFADEVDLQLNGLFEESVQGDAVLAGMMTHFGVQTSFNEAGVRLTKKGQATTAPFKKDFLYCPDLAQTLAVICAGTGMEGHFTGLQTLRIKETDRIAALQTELKKVGVGFNENPERKDWFVVAGKVHFQQTPSFATYEDHRMAMAFAPLALFHEIDIEEPEVVGKSYPDFWKDLKSLGFDIARR